MPMAIKPGRVITDNEELVIKPFDHVVWPGHMTT